MEAPFEVFGQESDRPRIDMIRKASELLPHGLTLWEWVLKIGISVADFCRVMKISRAMFYRMVHANRRPSHRLRAEIVYLSNGKVRFISEQGKREATQ